MVEIDCLKLPSSLYPVSPPQPSPDHNGFFVFGDVRGLSIGGVNAATTLRHFNGRLTKSQQFNIPFAWSADSRSILGVRQRTVKPSGWALGLLTPVLFSRNGTSRILAMLTNPAGPLDEMYWIGHSGMAIAAFGTQGSYYRPEHIDLKPTIAFVDAAKGKVLQSVPIAKLTGATAKWRINAVAPDSNGEHALISFSPNKWALWSRGRSSRIVPLVMNSWQTPFALSPGGEGSLIMSNLSATGIICEFNYRCPSPTPRRGPIAEYHHLPSGKRLWSTNGIAKNFENNDVPAISPDGRFALISIPANKVALVSMRNGIIIQEVPKSWTSKCAMGFSADGKTAWISGGSTVAFYRLRP